MCVSDLWDKFAFDKHKQSGFVRLAVRTESHVELCGSFFICRPSCLGNTYTSCCLQWGYRSVNEGRFLPAALMPEQEDTALSSYFTRMVLTDFLPAIWLEVCWIFLLITWKQRAG